LQIDESSIIDIRNICEISLKNHIITENTPPSIASGCIYYFIKKKDINISKKKISEICKISEVTINKCCKKMETNDQLFTEIFN